MANSTRPRHISKVVSRQRVVDVFVSTSKIVEIHIHYGPSCMNAVTDDVTS